MMASITGRAPQKTYKLYIIEGETMFDIYLVEFMPPQANKSYMFKKKFIYSCKDNGAIWTDIDNNHHDIKLIIKMNDFQHKFNTITTFLNDLFYPTIN